MKQRKIITVLFFLLFSIYLRGEKYSIQGKIAQPKEGEMFIISPQYNHSDTLGSCFITKGRFRMEGEITQACIALLKLKGEPGETVILLDSDKPYKIKRLANGKTIVQGGKSQQALNTYVKTIEKANTKLKVLTEQEKQAAKALHFKTASEIKQKKEKLETEIQQELSHLIEQNRGNLFAAYALTAGMDRMNLAALKKCYQNLNEAERRLGPAQWLTMRVASLKQIEKGSKAPDFTLPDLGGKPLSLYTVKGKLKIIDFWASWCGPCRMENPNMVKLYADYKDKGLNIISVSLDEKKEAWTKALEKDGMPWIHVCDLKGWKGEVIKQYGVESVPCIFILDENNHILAKDLRGENLRTFIASHLGEVLKN